MPKRSAVPIAWAVNVRARNGPNRLLAATVVLEEEHAGRFRELLNSHLEELQPRTAAELAFVETMAVARWRQLRIWSMQKTAVRRRGAAVVRKAQAERTTARINRFAA